MGKSKYTINNSQVGAVGENAKGTLNIVNNSPTQSINSITELVSALRELRQEFRLEDSIEPEVLVSLKYLEDNADKTEAPADISGHWDKIKSAGKAVCQKLYDLAITAGASISASWIIEGLKSLV